MWVALDGPFVAESQSDFESAGWSEQYALRFVFNSVRSALSLRVSPQPSVQILGELQKVGFNRLRTIGPKILVVAHRRCFQ